MSNASIKFEMYRGRRSWVVAGMIRVYDEAEAVRLASESDEPIAVQPHLVLVVDDHTGYRKLNFVESLT